MPWPDHIKTGELIPARMMIGDIINVCHERLWDETTSETARHYYEVILAHALLDRENHAHGKLRTLVKRDGTEKVANGLDTAWDEVQIAFDNVMPPDPSLTDLMAALLGIDHGGGG